ncbi:MAG: hypothetical protein KGV57_03965 [Fusobacterium sp.]|nr:hypothetical protein [Fusobacterium sp.]
MKKILTFIFCLYVSIISYSQVFKSEIYGNRGLEMMRESIINSELGFDKQSGSTQIVEGFAGNSRKYNSRGFLLGTVSNFTAFPHIRAGITVAYQRYKDKKDIYKTRDYALDNYVSYKYKDNIFTGSFGYSQAKNVEKREYSYTLEYGKLYKKNFYIYVNGKNTKQKYSKKEDKSFLTYGVGLTRFDYFDKFRLGTRIEYNIINKRISGNNRGRGSLSFYAGLGYFIYDDLIVDAKYRGIGNSKFYDSVISLGFTHLF